MSSLDSPLEVLALDYLGSDLFTAVVNNVWTWVAVVTAAVSVWGIRSISSSSFSSSPRYHFVSREASAIKPAVSLASYPVERLATAVEPDAVSTTTPAKVESPAAPQSSSSPLVFTSEGRTSGKFTLYYHNQEEYEEEEEADVNDDGDDECAVDGNGERKYKSEGVRNGWEVLMEMRIGDYMGFYRYQDLTVLNGNVVRLWDGCRRRNMVNAVPVVRCGGGNDW